MSFTDEELEKIEAYKRREQVLAARKEAARIKELAIKEFFEGEELTLSAEDRTAVDLAKADLQSEADAKTREAELLAEALKQLEE